MPHQQIYSRGTYGLLLKGPGHDTLAKSPDYPEDTLRALHPYFTIYANGLRDARGDVVPIISRIVLPDGESALVRTAPRTYRDFGGVTLTLLAHAMLFSVEETAHYACNTAGLAGATLPWQINFEDGTRDLPELSEADFTVEDEASALASWVKSPSHTAFLVHLALACWQAIREEKRVFIVSPDILNPQEALTLMRVVYALLPYDVRRGIGYKTLHMDGAQSSQKGFMPGILVHFIHPGEGESIQKRQTLSKGTLVRNDFSFDAKALQALTPNMDAPKSDYANFLTEYLNANAAKFITTYMASLNTFLQKAGLSCSTPELAEAYIPLWKLLETEGYLPRDGGGLLSKVFDHAELFTSGASPETVWQLICEAAENVIKVHAAGQKAFMTTIAKQMVQWYMSLPEGTAQEYAIELCGSILQLAADYEPKIFIDQLRLFSDEDKAVLTSRFINNNDAMIRAFYSKEFSDHTDLAAIFEYLRKKSECARRDREETDLLENLAFLQVASERINQLASQQKSPAMQATFCSEYFRQLENNLPSNAEKGLGFGLSALLNAWFDSISLNDLTHEDIKQLDGIPQAAWGKTSEKLKNTKALIRFLQQWVDDYSKFYKKYDLEDARAQPYWPSCKKWLMTYYKQNPPQNDNDVAALLGLLTTPVTGVLDFEIFFSFFTNGKSLEFLTRFLRRLRNGKTESGKPLLYLYYDGWAEDEYHPYVYDFYCHICNALLAHICNLAAKEDSEKFSSKLEDLFVDAFAFDAGVESHPMPSDLLHDFRKQLKRAMNGKGAESIFYSPNVKPKGLSGIFKRGGKENK